MSIQYAGGTNVNATFTGNVKADILANVESNLITAGWSLVQGNVPTVVTVTIASPAVVSWTAHGLVAGTRILFNTTGALPAGITAGSTVYFVIAAGLTSNAFEFSTSSGGAAVNTTGSQSGTHTCSPELLMRSATVPTANTKMRIRIRDNGNNCVAFSIENSGSTLAASNGTGSGGQLLPAAAKVFRIIANQYQVFIFTPITTGVRSFVAFGTLYLPAFLQGVITECAWLSANAGSDTDAANRQSFRTTTRQQGGSTGNMQTIHNAVLNDYGNQGGNGCAGGLMLYAPWGNATLGNASGKTGTWWHDSSALMVEPLMAWGNALIVENSAPGPSNTNELIRGQLWDAVLVCNTIAGDTTSTFDSHNWWNITDSDGNLQALTVVVP